MNTTDRLEARTFNPQAAQRQLSIALRAYEGLASRPRTRHAWSYVQCALWNARQDAVRAGILVHGTESYVFVTDRLYDANMRVEKANILESLGTSDVRV